MFNIKTDIEKNRLYIFMGNLEKGKDFGKFLSEIEKAVRFLKQGFSCISDLRGFKFEDSSHHFMQSVQETLWDAGVKLAIRIVDENSGKQFCFEEQSMVWPAYKIKIAFARKEAEAILDKRGL
ncbi:MAG: hypothetical protein CSA18_03295 [Deltaproteobacteria bacterium]|nr:MAG: hypothetical protein CSA18_03295 [Deltaproteobacteria bacterium]